MARFTTVGGGGVSGSPGPQGPAGINGADALWNFVGEYNNGADYGIGDVVTYLGGTYYRVGEPNPGYPPGTGYWITIAEPGSVGPSGPQGEPGTNGENGLDQTSEYLNSEWTDYTPVWTAESGSPLLADGTITGRYKQLGKTVFFNLRLTFGTFTTGAGGVYWTFTLPVPAKDTNYHFPGGVANTAGGWYALIGNGAYLNSTTSFACLTPADAATTTLWSAVTAGNPFGMGNTDFLTLSGTYESE